MDERVTNEPCWDSMWHDRHDTRYRGCVAVDDGNEEGSGPPSPTADLNDDEREQLDRLRAHMGFIDARKTTPRVVDERYEILRTLGHGGMGEVYQVRDRVLDSDKVALKLVSRKPARDVSVEQARLRDEARCLAQLRNHPHVVTVHDVGTHRGLTYLTMEYVDGSDLRRWCQTSRPTQAQTLRAYLDAGRGLQAAHDIGIVHRDFKPDNVLIDRSGTAKVADFGVAAALPEELAETVDGEPAHTSVCGTISYMSPEQMTGERPDARSDQFSFCVSLWESLSGALPYEWTDRETQRAAMARAPAGAERLPRWLRRTLMVGMAPSRARRFSEMREIIVRLERGLARPRKRARAVGVSIVLGTFMLVVGLVARTSPLEAGQSCEQFVGLAEWSWGPQQRDALRLRRAEAPESVDWAVARLDALSEQWTAGAKAACEDDRAPPVGRERECLEDWLDSLDAAIELLVEHGDRQTLVRAPELLERLTPPAGDFCAVQRRPREPELADLVDRARGAALLGDREAADEFSNAAIERAELIAGERLYTPGRADAHAARAEVLRRVDRVDEAIAALAVAEEQAVGSEHFEALAQIWMSWIDLMVAHERGRDGEVEGMLRRLRPLLEIANFDENALIHGELLETRALVDRRLGRFASAQRGHAEAAAFFGKVGRPLMAARSIANRGVLQHELGELEQAEAAYREALTLFARADLPASNPRMLGIRFNLALVLFDRYHAEDEPANGLPFAREAFAELQQVIDFGPQLHRLDALALACQWAAEIDDGERLREHADQARRELESSSELDPAFADYVRVRVIEAEVVGLHDPRAEQQLRRLLERPDDLETELLWGLLRTWVEHLERTDRCDEARALLSHPPGRDRLIDVAEFEPWLADRVDSDCP